MGGWGVGSTCIHAMSSWRRAWLHPHFYNWSEQENQFPQRLGASDAKFQRLTTTNQRLTCSRGDVPAPSHSLLLLPCNLQSHGIAAETANSLETLEFLFMLMLKKKEKEQKTQAWLTAKRTPRRFETNCFLQLRTQPPTTTTTTTPATSPQWLIALNKKTQLVR